MNQRQPQCFHAKSQQTNWPKTGFTLLELVMVMLVLSIIAGLTAPIFSQGLAATRITKENLQTMEKLRYASERLAREIRQVNYSMGSYDIPTMETVCPSSGSCLVFTKNDSTTTVVTIGFTGSAVTLAYSSPAVSATLTDEVSSLVFAYYDAGNVKLTTLPDSTNVAFIEYTLTLKNPVTGGSFSQRTRVALREKS